MKIFIDLQQTFLQNILSQSLLTGIGGNDNLETLFIQSIMAIFLHDQPLDDIRVVRGDTEVGIGILTEHNRFLGLFSHIHLWRYTHLRPYGEAHSYAAQWLVRMLVRGVTFR